MTFLKGDKMQSVSDVIENFILSTLADDDAVELSRNDLAKYFSCVPSQINYVLNTRFTLNKGFVIESARGGAGFVKVIRVDLSGNDYLKSLLELCDKPMSVVEANQILDNLTNKKYLDENENNLLKRAISAKSLNNPLNMDNIIRTNILKEIIIELMKRKR